MNLDVNTQYTVSGPSYVYSFSFLRIRYTPHNCLVLLTSYVFLNYHFE